MKLNWKKLYQRIRHGRTFDERYEYTVVKCTSLEDIERKHEYMLSTGWIQDGDVIDKYSSVSCWYKKPKVIMEKYLDHNALNGREQKTFDRKVLDGDITIPNDIEVKDILQIRAALNEIDPMQFYRSKDKERPDEASNWTEFKARNPELFNDTSSVSSFRIPNYGEDWKLFYGFDPLKMKYKTVLTGEVLNGTLLYEGPDGSVLQYTLRDNIPPNGRYTIHGTADSRNIIHVTKFTLTTL